MFTAEVPAAFAREDKATSVTPNATVSGRLSPGAGREHAVTKGQLNLGAEKKEGEKKRSNKPVLHYFHFLGCLGSVTVSG